MAITDLDVAVPVAAALPRMTEEEFVAWAFADEDRRAEWVDGEVVVMNAVELSHDRFTGFLRSLLTVFVEEHRLGEVFGENYQVRIPRQRRRRQPDVHFVPDSRSAQVERMQCNGPPGLIVEVVSPDSRKRDRVQKFAEYEAAGVPEYWLPDPPMRTFEAYALGVDGRYVRLPEADGKVYSTVITGVFFRPEWVWQLRPPTILPLLAEMSAERARLRSSPPPPPSDKPG